MNKFKKIAWYITWPYHLGILEPCTYCGRKYRNYFDVHRDWPDLCLKCGITRNILSKDKVLNELGFWL